MRPGSRPGAGKGGPPATALLGEDGHVWLFGLHAVRDALANPARRLHRLILTPNAAQRLADALGAGRIDPEIADPRRFPAPLDPQSVHQGAALAVDPLDWGGIDGLVAAATRPEGPPATVLALDRVTDPHNVGAILRSAEVFGAKAVIAPKRHAAPESGALAKSASGALERQPYLRVTNLADTIERLKEAGFLALGLDGAGAQTVGAAAVQAAGRPLLLVLGAEGPGLRERTRSVCDALVRIESAREFASLNVSNAAAVALFAATSRQVVPGFGRS